jgi:hypothetical protein
MREAGRQGWGFGGVQKFISTGINVEYTKMPPKIGDFSNF